MTVREWAFTMFNCLCSFGLGYFVKRWLAGLPHRIPSLHIAIGATRDHRVRIEMDGFSWRFDPEDAARFGFQVMRCAQWVARRRG
jgi:hypothetical protein